MVLKTEEGSMCQKTQVALRRQEKARNRFSPRASRKECSLPGALKHLDFSLARLELDFDPEEP